MNTYNINIYDSLTGTSVSFAKIYLLQTEGGAPIQMNGAPVAFLTDAEGTYTLQNDLPNLFVRVEATGYSSKNATLTPGNNTVMLGGVSGPTAIITGTRTFWNKYKTALIILALLIALFFLFKSNFIK